MVRKSQKPPQAQHPPLGRWTLNVGRWTLKITIHPLGGRLRNELPQRSASRRHRRARDSNHHPPFPQESVQGGEVGSDAFVGGGAANQSAASEDRTMDPFSASLSDPGDLGAADG